MPQLYTQGMSLDEQIGQLFMVGLPGTTPNQEIIELIERHHVGNIIFFQRNLQNIQQIRKLTQELQQRARTSGQRFPLLIATDQENGMVRRFGEQTTIFPGNMALGAIGSEEMAYQIAQATGRELLALGINMSLAPDVDVNNNPANPVIGVRSFGENPELVARLGSAMVRGYRNAEIVTTLKHFPGHGDTSTDSHLALPVIPFSLERLEEIELVPFKAAIAAGADAVMIAHLLLPQLMQNAELPSTVSPEIVRGLLREKLGFQGLIMTDCLEMNAISETIGTERGALLALQAGNDLILVSHRFDRQLDSIELVKQAVKNGSLAMETITEAAERVLSLKQRYCSWEKLAATPGLEVILSEEHQQLRNQAYELSTTLVKNEQGLIPLHLKEEQELLALFLAPKNYTRAIDGYQADLHFVQALQKRHANTETLVIPALATAESEAKLHEAIADADMLLVVTFNAHLDWSQAQHVQRLLDSGKAVIGLAIFNPYDLLAFPHLGTYLVTYESTQPALLSATKVLFGEITAQGRLPVTVE
jgi:beta-N-acetylhexosaminidase